MWGRNRIYLAEVHSTTKFLNEFLHIDAGVKARLGISNIYFENVCQGFYGFYIIICNTQVYDIIILPT